MNTTSRILFVLGICLLGYLIVKDSHSNNIFKNEIYRVVHGTTVDTINDIQKCKEAFLTSTTVGVLPVIKIDKCIINKGKPGNITLKIMELYNKYLIKQIK